MEMEYADMDMGPGPRRRGYPPRPPWAGFEGESISLQKEILWMVVTEGVTSRGQLLELYGGDTDVDVDLIIKGMIFNGFFEDINGYLRIHPDFSKNCYAIIR